MHSDGLVSSDRQLECIGHILYAVPIDMLRFFAIDLKCNSIPNLCQIIMCLRSTEYGAFLPGSQDISLLKLPGY